MLRRDSRLASADPKDPSKPVPHPVVWFPTQKIVIVDENENSISYEIVFQKPAEGWFGFFLEFSFKSLNNSVNIVTTETNVIPEFFPIEDCFSNECFGNLV
ncbi:autocrine proliferation repressor A-like [Brachionus plicatilis]|uniref:Autocrine proliferation repressor A-like n=1 Tax=Brachionus plicatilis TaxID=10195 RepID=A0A3M7Q4N5_BRAPC|nr:autocrine proliferation repressor A-like [Brachionus plicatilis]